MSKLKIAEIKTAPAATSLIIFISGLISKVIEFAICSIAVLNASADRTIAMQIKIRHHSIDETERVVANKMAIRVIDKWIFALCSNRKKYINPSLAYLKLLSLCLSEKGFLKLLFFMFLRLKIYLIL